MCPPFRCFQIFPLRKAFPCTKYVFKRVLRLWFFEQRNLNRSLIIILRPTIQGCSRCKRSKSRDGYQTCCQKRAKMYAKQTGRLGDQEAKKTLQVPFSAMADLLISAGLVGSEKSRMTNSQSKTLWLHVQPSCRKWCQLACPHYRCACFRLMDLG